jgi:hypothetical protein
MTKIRNFSINLIDSPVLFVCISIVWLNRIFSFISSPDIVLSPDSYDMYSGVTFDFSKLSFLGHALRPWPTTLMFALFGLKIGLILQLIISGVASSLLLITVNAMFQSRLLRTLTLTCLLIITSSADFVAWDMLLNIQSLTNSLIIFYFSFLILFIKKPNYNRFTLLAFSSILISIQRPALFAVFGVVTVISLIVCKCVGKRFTLSIFFIVTLFFVAIPSYNQNLYWPATYNGTGVVAHLKDTSPISHEFRMYLKAQNTPNCILQFGTSAIWPNLKDFCPAGTEWARTHAVDALVKFSLKHPGSTLDLLAYSFFGVTTNSSTHYASAVSVLPQPIDSLFIGTRDPKSIGVSSNSEFYLYAPLYFLLIVYLYSRYHYRNQKQLLFHKFLDLIVVTNFLSILAITPFLSSEWTRILEPNSLIFQISLILAIIGRAGSGIGMEDSVIGKT